MAYGEHDRPDPSLIVEGSRRPHPSKRIQGHDYPITPLEELHVRSKGMYSLHATQVHSENISVGIVVTGGTNPSGLDRNTSGGASSSYRQGNTYINDMPQKNGDTRGDALREDGTLKDASEMEWLHSPSDENKHSLVSQHEDGTLNDASELEWPNSPSEYNRSRNKRKRKDRGLELDESSGSEDSDEEVPRAKVSYEFTIFRGTLTEAHRG